MNLRSLAKPFMAVLMLVMGATAFAAETTVAMVRPKDIKDIDNIPFLKPEGKAAFKEWTSRGYNRAFAISPKDGSWGLYPDENDMANSAPGASLQARQGYAMFYVVQDAMERCEKKSGDKCFLYAQNGDVVWDGSIPQLTNVAKVDPEEEVRRLKEALAKAEEKNRSKETQAQAELGQGLKESSLTAEAKPKPATPILTAQRRALIFGNDSYQNVPKLKNARADAKSMAKVLDSLGYAVRAHYDVNERDMKKAIRDFTRGVSGGDEVLFYFAGHGVQIGSANYLLPMDIRAEDAASVRDEAIPLQRVLDDFSEVKAKLTLAIIDACRDNPFKGTGRAIGGRGLAPTSAATGQMVMFSAGSGQQALDNVGVNDKSPNGLFTRVFLKHVQKKGVTVDRIMRDVRSEVVSIAESVGHEQVPAIYDQVVGDFYFAR